MVGSGDAGDGTGGTADVTKELSGGAIADNAITDAKIASHTSTKITITAKPQLNTAIVFNDASNIFGDFDQTFKDNRIIIESPDGLTPVTIVNSQQSLARTITIGALTGNRNILVSGEANIVTGDLSATAGIVNGQLAGSIALSKLITPPEANSTADQTGGEIKIAYEGEVNAFTDTQFTKLAGIDTGATDDQTGAEIKTAYEAEVNAFTDTQFTKLGGIDTGATDDQTGAEIKTAYEAEANAYTDALNTKLGGIEALADVTDTANVNSALATSVGTITTGVWTGTAITGANINASSTDLTDTSSIAYLDTTNTYTAGVRQNFVGDVTNAPINVGTLGDSPSAPAEGDMWIEGNVFRIYSGAVERVSVDTTSAQVISGSKTFTNFIANGTINAGTQLIDNVSDIATGTISDETNTVSAITITDTTGAMLLGASFDMGSQTVTNSTGITVVGTITSGTWTGTAVASANLDADTAHLTTNQTFTGIKTFGGVADVGKLLVAGTTSGTTTIDATAVASGLLTLPAVTDTLAVKGANTWTADQTYNAGVDLIFDTGTGTQIGTGTTEKMIFYGGTPIVQPTVLTTAETTLTFVDENTPDFSMSSLTTTSSAGFASLDEAQAFMEVVINMQLRVGELETKLQALGLIA